MSEFEEELIGLESEVDRLTREVSGYGQFGQSTPKYMTTTERQSVGLPVDSGFATARQSSERASTEVDRIELERAIRTI